MIYSLIGWLVGWLVGEIDYIGEVSDSRYVRTAPKGFA